MSDDVKLKYEPHLYLTVGSHTDLWHRFTKEGPQTDKYGVYLETRCNRKIYDHYNIRSRFNPRIDRICAKCFPHGVNEDGSRKKPAERITAGDAAGDAEAAGRESPDTEGSRELTSTPEPLVPETPDGGDDGTTPEESGGVLRSGHTGHMEELPDSGGSRGGAVEGSTSSEVGQGKSDKEHSEGQSKQSTGARRKPTKGTS